MTRLLAPPRRSALLEAALVLVVAVVATAAFRAALPGELAANESTDLTSYYGPVAERLVDGDGLTTPDGEAALRYPPGHPLLLASAYTTGDALGVDHDRAADAATLLCAGLAATFVWAIARRCFGSTVARVAAALWVLHPAQLWLAKQPNSELPFEVLLCASVLAATPALLGRGRTVHAAAAAALLGAAVLVRPAGLLLVVPLVVALGWWSPGARARTAAAAAAAFLCVVLPWSWWASSQAGHLVLVADATSVNVAEGLTLGAADDAELATVAAPAGARAVARDALAREAALAEDGALPDFLAEQAQERPVGLGALLATKAARAWYGTDSGRAEPLVLLVQAGTALAAALGAVEALGRGRAPTRYAALAWTLVGAAWVTAVAVDSIARLLVPVTGLLVPLVALLVVSFVGQRGRPTSGAGGSEAQPAASSATDTSAA